MRQLITLFLLGALVVPAIPAYSQISTRFDSEVLRAQNADYTRAYDLVNIQPAWEAIIESGAPRSPVSVGIVDTGADANHAEFRNPNVNFGTSPLVARQDTFEKPKGHGTAVAGIIGANNTLDSGFPLNQNSPQMNGILSGVLDEQQYTLELENHLATMGAVVALEKLVVRNPVSVNMSFGLPKCSAITLVQQTVTSCAKTDAEFNAALLAYARVFNAPENRYILFVASAGNWGINVEHVMPARFSYPHFVTVGATDFNDGRAIFDPASVEESNFGSEVDISAPSGTLGVYAPKKGGGYQIPGSVLNFPQGFTGTSAAAPFVTGVAGLLKSIKPNLTPSQIRDILVSTGDPISTDKPIGPRLNAHAAVCHPLVLNCGGAPEGYDYASDFIRVVGNIPSIPGCTADGDVRFVDNFDDNNLNGGCTANFSKLGTFTEFGNFLHYDRSGAVVSTITGDNGVFELAEHRLTLASTMSDGGGDATFTVALRPDPPTGPNTGQPFTSYGIFFFGCSGLTVQVYDDIPEGPGDPGGPTIAAFSVAGSAFASLSFPTSGPLQLRIAFSDAANALSVAFSTNGGTTYQMLTDGIPATSSGPAFLSLFAFQEELQSALSASALSPQTSVSAPTFSVPVGMRMVMLSGHDGTPPIPV